MDGKLSTYRTIDTLGKSQVDLILQVYDGAIAAFRAAAEHYVSGELQGGYEQLERARKLLVHLYTTLDQGKGGEAPAEPDEPAAAKPGTPEGQPALGSFGALLKESLDKRR
jgi:flagellin-specific chaperone FliS